MKIETICLPGQHTNPWGIIVDDMLDVDIPLCKHEKAAALYALVKYPGATVYTTSSPEHYSNIEAEQSMLSWNGFQVHGDRASIAEVKRLVEFEAARRIP